MGIAPPSHRRLDRTPLPAAVALILLTGLAAVGRAGLDDNANGLSDVWEAVHGRGLDPDHDTDRDGQSNRVESRAGTDPRSPLSRFEAVASGPVGSAARLSWSSVRGKRYQIEVSTALTGGSWERVGPEIVGDGSEVSVGLPLETTFRTGGPLLSRWTGYTSWSFDLLRNWTLTGTPSPTWTVRCALAEAPSNDGSNYAQWMRGWLVPPVSGNYTFWIASDDFSELWLSSNASSSSDAKQRIAQVLPGNWTSSREWTRYASQQSAPRYLEAGRPYYFEAFHKQGGGGDNLAVAWEGPGIAREPIPGNHIAASPRSLAEDLASGSLFLRVVAGDADTDGDGVDDAEEWLSGFDAANPTTTPRVPDADGVRAALSSRSRLTIGAPVSRGYEAGPVPGRFTVFRSGGIEPLTVAYTVGGDAVAGTDYEALTGRISFGPAEHQAAIELHPLPDGLMEPGETVTVTLQPDPAYDLGAPSSATVTIDDEPDEIFVALLRPPDTVRSGGSGSAVLRKAGNDRFAQLSLQFQNLTAEEVGATLFISSTGDGGPAVLELASGQIAWQRWEFDPVTGIDRTQILEALDEGRLWVRVRSARFPGGEIVGRFERHPAWQVMPAPPDPPPVPSGPPTAAEAARFLVQASFGPTPEEIDRVRTLGFEGWIDDQFARPATHHLPCVQTRRAQLLASSNGTDDGWQRPRQEAWWEAVLAGQDPLRQRLAFALSQILVVSDIGVLEGDHEPLANYYDLLVDHAFGNYRDLLGAVTLNPCMGRYLSMLRNRKPDPLTGSEPDENYAREVMQLFTIGLNELHPDGSLKLDSEGMPVATYTQADIIGLAHVLTGWSFAYDGTVEPNFFWGPEDMMRPMVQYPAYHETGEKRIIGGVTLPAGQTGEAELEVALDTLFHHPNVGPFIARQLIQRFVTSNPSPGYIYRVARRFDDNGQGIRGDLRAVVKAILLDPEARSPEPLADTGFGKLREPLLRMAHLLRTFNARPPSAADPRFFVDLQYSLNQAPLKSPSVFNFFQPGYLPPGRLAAAGLYGPEFQITSESTAIGLTNLLFSTLDWGIWTPEPNGRIELDLSREHGILFAPTGTRAERQSALLDHLDLLLLNGRMSLELRDRIRAFWDSLPSWFDEDDDDPETPFAWGRSQQIEVAIYLIAASPEYAIQK